MPKFSLTFFLAAILLHSGLAGAGIEPGYEAYGEIAYTGPGIPTLCNVPDGSGDALTNAQLPNGNRVDATMTLYLLDMNADPIANFPAEDLWLETVDAGLALCPAGSIADSPTDQNGVTTWTAPLLAGGSSQALTQILINGASLMTSAGFELDHVSPDIDGDLTVNLKDIALFAQDFAAGYAFRSDFSRDGILNIADIAPLARAIGANCP